MLKLKPDIISLLEHFKSSDMFLTELVNFLKIIIFHNILFIAEIAT